MKSHVLLILDEESVAESRGVTFHLNAVTKHPEKPVMLPGEPHQWDSLCVSWPGTVLYSPRDRTFRCWYLGLDVVQTPERIWHTGYAESDDGIHWTKPDLGQVEFLGRPTNQIHNDWGAYYLSFVFENPLPDAPPSQRFGGFWTRFRFEDETNDWNKAQWCKTLAWSPDGVRWTFDCIAYSERPYMRDPCRPFLDIYQLLYDPDDSDAAFRWKGYSQIFVPRPDGWGPPGVRNIGLVHGTDVRKVENATNPVILSPLASIDEELHFAVVRKIGGQSLMLLESDRFSKNPIHGDLRLAVSRDGRNFRRVHPRAPLVATGPKGTWDENLLVTNSAGWQEVGDEVWIHYFGCPRMYQSWPAQYEFSPERRGSHIAPVYLGLATLPRDRFAYATGDGTLTTRPLELTADGLWLNATGDPQVTALDESGKSLARGKLGEERRLTVYRKVVWKDASPSGTHRVRLALTARDRLFSMRWGR